MEEHLEEVLDQMCNQLPEGEYERISSLIWQERQQELQAREEARRFAVFHVTEGGASEYFETEEPLEFLQVANRLRDYIRRQPENKPDCFRDTIANTALISREEFDAKVTERLDNTGRITGAFDINLDEGTVTALNIMDGWQSFRVQDVSTAAYFAMKKTWAQLNERWDVFLERLDGKQLTPDSEFGYLTGYRTIRADEIIFTEDIRHNENKLTFCMDVGLDYDTLWGNALYDPDEYDFLNVRAHYDLDTQSVCDALDVYRMNEFSDDEQEWKYRLSDKEKALFRSKMDAYCREQLGYGLEECCRQYCEESVQDSPNDFAMQTMG